MLPEEKVYEIMNKIDALEAGQSVTYFKGKSCWMSDMDERLQKKLQDFFTQRAASNKFFFTQRRLTDTRFSEYEYVATKSRRLFN